MGNYWLDNYMSLSVASDVLLAIAMVIIALSLFYALIIARDEWEKTAANNRIANARQEAIDKYDTLAHAIAAKHVVFSSEREELSRVYAKIRDEVAAHTPGLDAYDVELLSAQATLDAYNLLKN